MSTNDKLVNIYLKKFLPQEQMKENFLEFLIKQQKDNLAIIYPGQGFFYGNAMSGTGPDEVTLETPSLATDGLANLLKLDPTDAAFTFENALGIPYYVGLRYNILEDDTEINVRTGQIEYVFFKDGIGEKGEPDQVVDNGTTLTLTVDAVTELGVTNAGRKAIVYLKRAQSRSEAFYIGEVEYVAGKNVVNTTHLIGQTAGLVSIDPTDYVVFIPGPTVRRNTDLSLDPNVAFVGVVTGVGAGNTPGPGDIDTSGSTVLFTGAAITPTIDSLRAFFVGGGNIIWDVDTGTVTWSADFKFVLASKAFNFTISAGNVAGLADGEALYFVRDEVGGIKPLIKAAITAVPHDPYYEVLIFRYGNDLLFRNGVLELQGEVGGTTTGRIDGITQDLLDFIGADNESDGSPAYTTAIGGGPYSNQHVVEGEGLRAAIKRLDLRNDIVNKVDYLDLNTAVLPATASVTIDGGVLVNGNKVLFANAALNGIYQVAGIGVAATWTKLHAFGGSQSPLAMSLVGVKSGDSEHFRNVFYYDTTNGWNPLDTSKLEAEPTGFPNRTDSEISFDDGTRTFTIQPKSPATKFDYAIRGKFFRKEAAQTVVIPDVEGLHYIYFDGAVLSSTQVFSIDIIISKAFVATVSWDATNNVAVMVGEERHALTMDGPTHAYLHQTQGTRYVDGLGLTFDDAGDGTADTDVQVAVGDGRIFDEDLEHSIVDDPAPTENFEQILDPIAEIPVYYRDGAAGDWRKDAATTFPVKQGAARIQFNDPAGPWTQVDASLDGNFVAMWLFATNNINEPIIAILGQREDTTLELAQENNRYETLSFGDLPSLEMKVLFRAIFQTDSAYSNTVSAKLVDVRDLRLAIDISLSAYTPSAHNLLSARNAPNSHPAAAISTDTSAFTTALTEFDTQVQKALETLGIHSGQLRIREHPVTKTKIVITGATFTLNSQNKLRLQQENLTLKFDGAVIDALTGEVFEEDGITPLGVDFTPIVPALNQWRWLSITMIPGTVNPDNTINAQLSITPALADGATMDGAERASFVNGIKIGQFAIQENGSGSLMDILDGNFEQQGVGGSSGGGSAELKVHFVDPVSTVLPTGPTVTIDGVAGVNDDLVLFTGLLAGNNRVYKLSGVGAAIAWTAQPVFENGLDPVSGEVVRATKGVGFTGFAGVFDGNTSAFNFNDFVRYFNGADYWEKSSLKTSEVLNNTTANLFTITLVGSENLIVFWSVIRNGIKAVGQSFVTTDGVTITSPNIGGDLGVTGVDLFADISGADLRWRYTADNSGPDGIVKYFVFRWSDGAGGPGGLPNYSGSGISGTLAGGALNEIQFHGAGGVLDGDPNFKWDAVEKHINMNGLCVGALSAPITILDNQPTVQTLFSYVAATYKSVFAHYSIDRGTERRSGILMITTNGTVVSLVDLGNDTGGADIDKISIPLTAIISGADVVVQYKSSNSGDNATFKYSTIRWS